MARAIRGNSGANQRRHKLGHKASIYKYILDAHVTRTMALSVRLESGRMAETIDCRMNQQLSSTTAAKKTSWDQLDGHFHSSYDLHHAVRGHDVDAPSEYHRDSRQKVSPYWHYPFALMRRWLQEPLVLRELLLEGCSNIALFASHSWSVEGSWVV